MKFASLAAIALVSSTDAKLFDFGKKKDSTPSTPSKPTNFRENTLWLVEGVKGYHDGFTNAFYKQSGHGRDTECLNDETIDNMVKLNEALSNPVALIKNVTNIQEDFTYFADAAEVVENLGKCRFEGVPFDILHVCASDKTACTPTKFLENLTKNMFVLVGKMTSMAESVKGFPKEGQR